MRTFLLVLLVLSGLLFVGCVMLMSPKGGLGAGIAGTSGSTDYGSKKSVESTLKTVAIITSIIFVVVSLFLPYSA